MRLNITIGHGTKEQSIGISLGKLLRPGAIHIDYGWAFEFGALSFGLWGLTDTTTEAQGRAVAVGRELHQAVLRPKLNSISRSLENTARQMAADGAAAAAFSLYCFASVLEGLAENPEQPVEAKPPAPVVEAAVVEPPPTPAQRIDDLAKGPYADAAKQYIDKHPVAKEEGC